jgi:hypothetical protein
MAWLRSGTRRARHGLTPRGPTAAARPRSAVSPVGDLRQAAFITSSSLRRTIGLNGRPPLSHTWSAARTARWAVCAGRWACRTPPSSPSVRRTPPIEPERGARGAATAGYGREHGVPKAVPGAGCCARLWRNAAPLSRTARSTEHSPHRQAVTNASNNGRCASRSSASWRYSGCHWTPSTHRRPGISTASVTPSSGLTATTRPGCAPSGGTA